MIYVPSSLVHLNEIRSNAYVSPVMIYFPVSPVAPPKSTTLDFETISQVKYHAIFGLVHTLSDSVAESGERDLSEDFYFLHILLFQTIFEF
jgi:hypothetical protein